MRVTFATSDESTKKSRAHTAIPGQTLLDVAHTCNVDLIATCGGRGRCRSCRVKILRGVIDPPTSQDQDQLGSDEIRDRFRLACQTAVTGDCDVLIAPASGESGYQILGSEQDAVDGDLLCNDSGVEQHYVSGDTLKDLSDQDTCSERILSELPQRVSRKLGLEIVRDLSEALTEDDGAVWFTTFRDEIIVVEPNRKHRQPHGIAIDIGTTTIVASLFNLTNGQRIASTAATNPQSIFGGDLMSRIAFAQGGKRQYAALRGKMLKAINDLITQACIEADVPQRSVFKMTFVANACMHHILLGIDITSLGVAPYSPVVREAFELSASDIPIKAAPRARICMLPLIAGFVGSDTTGALLATDFIHQGGTRLLVDIGTNTEVVLIRDGDLIACSAPAGPAFEGGQIRDGMRAAIGAIERVNFGDLVECAVIGDAAPTGICGSGLIDALASMLEAGVVNSQGLLRQENNGDLTADLRSRLIPGDLGGEFVLVEEGVSGTGKAIAITQADIRQLQLAKGAIYAAVSMLCHVTKLDFDSVDELLLCGGFGNYLNLESAVRIRMLPKLCGDRVRYVGNAAHTGAERALLSEQARMAADVLAKNIAHVSLAEEPGFQEIFIDAMGF